MTYNCRSYLVKEGVILFKMTGIFCDGSTPFPRRVLVSPQTRKMYMHPSATSPSAAALLSDMEYSLLTAQPS